MDAIAARVFQRRVAGNNRGVAGREGAFMAEVVFLHIGAMKSGTTFLQSLMSANKSQLLAAGCLFLGRRG